MIVLVSFARASLVLLLGVLGAASWACGEAGGRSGAPPAAGTATVEAGEGGSPGTVRDGAAARDIVFIGTSLTAGYGLDDPDLAYPALLGRHLSDSGDACRVVNAGVSGDTSAGGRARLGQLLDSHGPSLAVLVVELGANDGLRGQSHEAMYDNLTWMVRETRRRYPEAGIVVAGMEAPTNLGPVYTEPFRDVFTRVAEENDAPLIPFLLEGVAAVPELNQADGIHPNERGHEAVAEHVWSLLGDYLGTRCAMEGAR